MEVLISLAVEKQDWEIRRDPELDTEVYACHTNCDFEYEAPERWSWFWSDINEGNIEEVCFQCGEFVPKEVQALVMLATP